MSKSLKSKIYRLLDEIEDETILNQLMEDVAFYATKKDIVDDLSPAQQKELNKAIQEADNKETITWDEFKEEMNVQKKMGSAKTMRHEVKKYIDSADIKVVKLVYAVLEADAGNDWWDTMPDKVKADLEAALNESEKGKVIPNVEIQKRYKKWLAR